MDTYIGKVLYFLYNNHISLVLFLRREPESDSSANSQPREVVITAKGESLYSEVVPRNKRKKRSSTNSADVKADNAYCNSEPTEAPTEGYTSLLIAGGQEDTGAQPQEALYDQPVSLTVYALSPIKISINHHLGLILWCFLSYKIPVKAKTLEGRADNNRNDSRTSTANCEGTRATQDVSIVQLLYCILECDINSHLQNGSKFSVICRTAKTQVCL